MGQHRWPGEVLANFRSKKLSLVTLLSAIGVAIIFNLCSIASGQGTEFNLVETEDGFYVSVNGLKVLEHSAANPLVHVGVGEATFKEEIGNFLVYDPVQERIPLDGFLFSETHSDGTVEYQMWHDPDFRAGAAVLFRPAVRFPMGGMINPAFPLTVQVKVWNPDKFNRVWLNIYAEPDEKVFGGGEQFTYFNLRGKEFPIWTREGGIGRDEGSFVSQTVNLTNPGAAGDYHTSYYPIPLFLSTRKYYAIAHEKTYMVMNFGKDDKHEFFVHGNGTATQVTVSFLVSNRIKSLMSLLSKWLNTDAMSLPDWVFNGAIISIQGGTERLIDIYRSCADAGVKIAAVWIQDWSGKFQTQIGNRVFWNWRWNETHYPDLDTIIADLRAENVRLLAYVNPYLNTDGDMFEEAAMMNYLLKDKAGEILIQDHAGFYAGTVDLSNPEAFQWYSEEVLGRNMLDLGISGWMVDFAEYIPTHAANNLGMDVESFHNIFPDIWAKCNFEALMSREKLHDTLTFQRSGTLGSSVFQQMVWAGDQNVNYEPADGLPSVITAALSGAVSGLTRTHSDIGGYTSFFIALQRDTELLMRWAEHAVFTPVMRTHEGSSPEANEQIYSDPAILSGFARLVNLYVTLSPYTKAAQRQLQQGLPGTEAAVLRVRGRSHLLRAAVPVPPRARLARRSCSPKRRDHVGGIPAAGRLAPPVEPGEGPPRRGVHNRRGTDRQAARLLQGQVFLEAPL
jgi:alpha-glucosidase